jgi:hypothetical protein
MKGKAGIEIMDRRQFLQSLLTGIAAVAGESCATGNHRKPNSKEVISSVLTTTDESTLVVITDRYHYIFTVPSPLVAALKGSFHPYVQAQFLNFYVDVGGGTRGTVVLSLLAAPGDAIDAAITAGFSKVPGGAEYTTSLSGFRYFPRDNVRVTARYKLNRSYEVNVDDDLKTYAKPSPIMMAAGYLTVYGTLLVVAPQVYTSR